MLLQALLLFRYSSIESAVFGSIGIHREHVLQTIPYRHLPLPNRMFHMLLLLLRRMFLFLLV